MLMQSVGISVLDCMCFSSCGNSILLESCLMRWHFFYEASSAVYKTVKNITNASVDWGTTTISNRDIQGLNPLLLLLYFFS